MNLKSQIITLLISFIFGVIFSVLVNLNYKYLFHHNKKVKILVTITFVLNMALIFFLIMQSINNGIIHYYFYIMLSIGFLSTFSFTKSLRNLNVLSKIVKKKK